MKPIKWIIAALAVLAVTGCESAPPTAVDVDNPDAITVDQFGSQEESLATSVEVTLDDGSTVDSEVEWETSLEAFDTSEHGTFEIEGELLNETFDNPDAIKALQSVVVEPVSIDEALSQTDDVSHFKTMYSGFDHPDKADARTVFVPSDDAIDEVLEFLDMDLDALMEHGSFESLMLDHMSEENITTNRLETNVPGVYETLRGKELIVEGEQGSPLVDSEHAHLDSADLDDSHIHYIDGVILSDDTLSMVGSDLFDDDMGERLLEILRDQGLVSDILLGRKFTMFIPDESALLAYAQDEGLSLEELLESPEFETLIMGHIVREEQSAESLYENAPFSLTAVNGASIDITVSEGDLHAGGALVKDSESVDQFGTLLTIDDILEQEDE